jgi:hypothetical protein
LKELPAKFKTLNERGRCLPEINFSHLRALTDDTGILQHARFTVPNRDHGYCTDDNSRALIVAVMAAALKPQEPGLNLLVSTYLSFLIHAFDETAGRFRNFLSYDRRWINDGMWEDAHARAVRGLGFTKVYSRNKGYATTAKNLFDEAVDTLEDLEHPRAMANALIGIHMVSKYYSSYSRERRISESLARKLRDRFCDYATADWPWFEDSATYANACVPHALIVSGQWMQDVEMHDIGLNALQWLRSIQTDVEKKHFSPIGCNGWHVRGGEKAHYDQQPIEADTMLEGCIAAFNSTMRKEWIDFAWQCLNWFLGENDRGIPLYDHSTGGCRDGLEPQGVNENQGAESTLSWLNALLVMHRHLRPSRPNRSEKKEGTVR